MNYTYCCCYCYVIEKTNYFHHQQKQKKLFCVAFVSLFKGFSFLIVFFKSQKFQRNGKEFLAIYAMCCWTSICWQRNHVYILLCYFFWFLILPLKVFNILCRYSVTWCIFLCSDCLFVCIVNNWLWEEFITKKKIIKNAFGCWTAEYWLPLTYIAVMPMTKVWCLINNANSWRKVQVHQVKSEKLC